MSKSKHSDCPYCSSEQTIPLRNYGILAANEEVLHLIVNVKI